MIESWELAHFPFENDPLRFKARVKGTEEDVKQLVAKLPVESGKPFVTLSQEYDWAFYLYKLDDSVRGKVLDVFRSFSQNGTVVETATLQVEKELPPMLEDVLEAAAKTMIQTDAPEKEPPKKQRPDIPTYKPGTIPKAEAPRTEAAPPAPAFPPPAPSAEPVRLSAEAESASTPLNPSYSFIAFIVGPNNRFTHAAAQAVAENPGKIYNPFFIYGGVGLGKTHLMQAIGHSVLVKNPESKVMFISTEKFTSLVIEAIRLGTTSQLREQFRKLDLLLIDDIQFLAGSESTQEEFFHVFNNLHQMGKQIVMTCDRPPKQLSTLEDRLRSRFEWGLITDLKAPNLETRVAILKSKADQIDLTLTHEQLMFVAEKSKSNIRELEGIIKKIFATSHLMNAKVDMNLLKNVVSEEPGDGEPRKADAPSVAVAAAHPPKAEPKPEHPPKKESKEKKDGELEGIMQRLNQALKPAPEAPPKPEEVRRPEAPKPFPIPPPTPAEPPKAVPAAPTAPAASVHIPSGAPVPADEQVDPDEPDIDMALRPVELVCFYPRGKKEQYRTLRTKFNLILKKHKLKFRLSRLAERSFNYEGKLDYHFFSKICREVKCSIALVLGPPPTPLLSEDDFAGLLSTALEEERIALQFIPWSEMGKDYRYLNCALDLSLLTPVPEAKQPPKP